MSFLIANVKGCKCYLLTGSHYLSYLLALWSSKCCHIKLDCTSWYGYGKLAYLAWHCIQQPFKMEFLCLCDLLFTHISTTFLWILQIQILYRPNYQTSGQWLRMMGKCCITKFYILQTSGQWSGMTGKYGSQNFFQ